MNELMHGIMKRCQYSCKAIYKVRTTGYAPLALCTFTLINATNANALHCDGFNR